MPKNTPNPGDAAADEARRADEQKSDDARRQSLHDEAEKNLAAQREAEEERRGQSADAASLRGVAVARLTESSHLSEAEAAEAYDAAEASRDPTTFLHAERAVQVPDATYGVTARGLVPTPPLSPQNRMPDNTPLPGQRDGMTMTSGPLAMPPYSPQNRPYDGGRPPQHDGAPQPPQFRDTAIAAGIRRPLDTVLQEGESTVAMLFERPVKLTLNDQSHVDFPAGVNQVPEHLADHAYLRAYGVKRV